MRAILCGWLILAAAALAPAGAQAEGLAEADRLYAQGGLENLARAIPLYRAAADQAPGSYEANWKCARALRDYGDRAKKQAVEGWKKTCAEYGKEAMQYAQKAAGLEPSRPEGHYYYGLSVGIYSDGVSIVTALSEGLKEKTQSSFEKAYAIDKLFNRAGPMLSLGRFWSVLPWPLRDRDKALAYFREYQQTGFFDANAEAQVYLADLLIQMGGDENRREAKGHLEKAARAEDRFFKEWANRLLAELAK
jgi:hypothetical protein